MCKGGDVFSLAVLIDRGLDLRYLMNARTFSWVRTQVTDDLLIRQHIPSSLYSVLKVLEWQRCRRPLHSNGQMPLPHRVGVDDGGGTPVPIPNTAVKPTRADNTWLEAARNDR